MTNHGTAKASANDSWSAYTHITAGGLSYEIRHPKAAVGRRCFTIHRWNDLTGHTYYGACDTLEQCVERLRATEEAVTIRC